MRGMFGKITGMKNCGAKNLWTERGLSEGKILKMALTRCGYAPMQLKEMEIKTVHS